MGNPKESFLNFNKILHQTAKNIHTINSQFLPLTLEMVVDLMSLLTQPSVVAVCGVEVVAEGAERNVRIVRVVIIVEGGH